MARRARRQQLQRGAKSAVMKQGELNTGTKIASFPLLILSGNPADGVISPTFRMGLLSLNKLSWRLLQRLAWSLLGNSKSNS